MIIFEAMEGDHRSADGLCLRRGLFSSSFPRRPDDLPRQASTARHQKLVSPLAVVPSPFEWKENVSSSRAETYAQRLGLMLHNTYLLPRQDTHSNNRDTASSTMISSQSESSPKSDPAYSLLSSSPTRLEHADRQAWHGARISHLPPHGLAWGLVYIKPHTHSRPLGMTRSRPVSPTYSRGTEASVRVEVLLLVSPS